MNELLRQAVHLIFGLVGACVYYFFGKEILFVFALSGLIIGGLVYLYHRKFKVAKIERFLQEVERGERKGFSGFLFFGMLLIFSLHPLQSGVLVLILIVSISDCLSALIGKRFGTKKYIEGKTIEGSLAFVVSSGILLFLFGFNPLLGIFLGIIEALPFEDNLSLAFFGPFVLGL